MGEASGQALEQISTLPKTPAVVWRASAQRHRATAASEEINRSIAEVNALSADIAGGDGRVR